MARVVMVANSDYWHDSRVQKEAVSLNRAGYQVTVFSLAMKGPQEQWHEGVRVVNPTTGKLAWLPYKPSYLRAYLQIAGALLGEEGDVWHGHDLETLPFVFVASWIKGGKLVYDSHELWRGVNWPDSGGRWNFARRLLWNVWLYLEKVLAGRCNLVITVTDSCAAEIAASLGIRAPLVVRNYASRAAAGTGADSLRLRLGLADGEKLVVYAGNLQRERGLENFIKAWAGLPGGAHLAFVGQGPLEVILQDYVIRTSLKNVYFITPVKAWELPGFICGADLGIVLTGSSDLNSRCSLPNKLFEYFAAGVPVLASDLPEIRNLVTRYNAGVLIDPGDCSRVEAVLAGLLDRGERLSKLKLNAIKAGEDLTWEREVKNLVDGYAKITNRKE